MSAERVSSLDYSATGSVVIIADDDVEEVAEDIEAEK